MEGVGSYPLCFLGKKFRRKSEHWSRWFHAAMAQPWACFKYNKCHAYSDVIALLLLSAGCNVKGWVGFNPGFPHEAAIENIWRTSATKRQECSKLGMGPNCPLQTQTVPGFSWDLAIGASHSGAFRVCRWDPSQGHFRGSLSRKTVQELEFTAPVICCLLCLTGISPRCSNLGDATPPRAALLEREGDSHLPRSGRFLLTR